MNQMFLLVLSGAAVWGATNVLQRYFFRDRNVSVEMMIVATMLGAGTFSLLAQLFWFGVPQVSPLFWKFVAVTALLNILFIFFENKSLQLEDASIVAPILGVTPVFVILTSWIILGEFPTVLGLIGIVVAAFGVYILGLEKSGSGNIRVLTSPLARLSRSQGARFALAAALLASVSLNFDKLAVLYSTPMMRSFVVFFVVALAAWFWSFAMGRWKSLDKELFLPLYGVGLLIGLSSVLMDWGFLFGIVPYVAALKRTQMAFTALLAGIFLGEKDIAFRLAASLIIVAGLVLIAF